MADTAVNPKASNTTMPRPENPDIETEALSETESEAADKVALNLKTPGGVKPGTSFMFTPSGGKAVGHGSTGGVYCFENDPTIVAKVPFVDMEHIESLWEERRILLRLGADGKDGGEGLRHIVRYIRLEPHERGARLILERAKYGTVREYLRDTEDGKQVTLPERIRWCYEAAEAVVYIHSKGVIQGDFGTRNILLREDRTLCLCDFAGSGVDGKKPVVWAQSGFRHPDRELFGTIQGELHALGSVFYELITSTAPHWEEERAEIELRLGEGKAYEMMKEGIYPDVSSLPLGNVISKCWKSEYSTAQAVLDALREEVSENNPNFVALY